MVKVMHYIKRSPLYKVNVINLCRKFIMVFLNSSCRQIIFMQYIIMLWNRLHVLRAYAGIVICKTSNFNYMNFRVCVQVPALNINHPAGHHLPRPVHRDHVMSMVVIVLFSSSVWSPFFPFCLYTTSISQIITTHDISHHRR